MSFTLTSSGAIIMKAGANANTTAVASGALLKEFCDQAEGMICSETRVDWVTSYSTYNTNFKKILDAATSDKAAMMVIKYDMAGFTSRAEATAMLNVLYDEYQSNLKLLNDPEVRRAMGVI